ncbi:MAG: type II secretion system F family protein [Bacillota bacterium]
MKPELTSLLLIIFGACSLLVIGLHRSATGRNRELVNRLKNMRKSASHREESGGAQVMASQKILESVSRSAVKIGFFNKLARMVDKNLTGADIPLKSEEYIILTAGGSVLAGILSTLIFLDMSAGILAGVSVIVFSILWVRMAKVRRLHKFNSQIGDSLVIMSNSLRSGFSFLQAMDMVRKELPNPISREFGRAFQEMNLGTPTEEALENLSSRVGSEDLDLVITAVLIQRQVGGNLAEILDNIAATIRERIRIKGEIKTLTAQGKVSGIIIGILPFALAGILWFMSPDYLMPLFTDPMGIAMLVSALILETVGILLIRKIINIEI